MRRARRRRDNSPPARYRRACDMIERATRDMIRAAKRLDTARREAFRIERRMIEDGRTDALAASVETRP